MQNKTAVFAVNVIYALPDFQKVITININEGTSFIDAVRQSGMINFFPDLDIDQCKLGTFGRTAKHDEILKQGQRVEIYRPLIADPKDVRRRRAEKAKLAAQKKES